MWNWPEDQIVLVLLRHGMTKANKEHRYLGKTEEPLTEESREVLLAIKAKGSYPRVEHVFVSPMKRCLETAELIYPECQRTIVPEWEEIDFGAFEGKNYAELNGDERYQAWIDSNGTLPFPEGESREEFMLRCEAGFQRMLGQLAEQPVKRVGVVAHGGTIMSLLSRYYGGEYFDYQVANGEGYLCRLEIANGEAKITAVEKLG